MACIVCLDSESDPPPIQAGCACRSDTGLVHVACAVACAKAMHKKHGHDAWRRCGTCKQAFTGAVQLALGLAWWRHASAMSPCTERTLAASNLAECYRVSGEYAKAEGLAHRALATWGKTSRDSHCLIRALINLARIFCDQGKHLHAARIETRIFLASRRIYGGEHNDTLVALSNLAISLTHLKRHATAEHIQRRVVEVQQRLLGEESSEVLRQRTNLAATLARQGKFDEADTIARAVIETERRSLGSEHPTTLTSQSNLAVSLSSQGRYDEAEAILRAVVGVQRRVLGEEHPHTLRAALNLANVLAYGQKKHREAIPLLESAGAAYARTLGADHPMARATATSLRCVRASM
jgi:tetratricopeptide (TPR) repeat protein